MKFEDIPASFESEDVPNPLEKAHKKVIAHQS